MSAASLKLSLDALDAKIADAIANAQPDYSIDGESITFTAYLSTLLSAREGMLKAVIAAEGPTEIYVQATT